MVYGSLHETLTQQLPDDVCSYEKDSGIRFLILTILLKLAKVAQFAELFVSFTISNYAW